MSEMDDPGLLWGELLRDAHARGPRLDPAFWGYCPSCGLGASDGGNWVGVHWGVCLTCRVRWLVTLPRALALYQLDDDSAAEFVQVLGQCIQFDDAPVAILPLASPMIATIIPEEITFMRQTAPPSFGIDPQSFQGPRDLLALHPLPKHLRIRLTDCILVDLLQHPPFQRYGLTGQLILPPGADQKLWDRVRYIVVESESGRTFEQVLRSDPAVSPMAVKNLMELFGKLLERRAELEARLRDLDVLEPLRPAAVPVAS